MAVRNLDQDLEAILDRVCDRYSDFESNCRDLDELRDFVGKLVNGNDFDYVEYVCERLENSVNFDNLLDEISDFFYTISLNFKNQKQFKQSLKFAQKSLKYSQKFEMQSFKSAKFTINLASILSKLEQHYSSIIYLKDSLEILNSFQNQSLPEIKELTLIALFNLGSEAENTKDYDEAYMRYKESLSFMNNKIFPPPELLSSKLSSSITRIQKLIKMKTHTSPSRRKKSSPRAVNISNSCSLKSRSVSKSINNLARGSTKLESSDLNQSIISNRTTHFNFKINIPLIPIKKLQSETNRISDSRTLSKMIYKKRELKDLYLDQEPKYLQDKEHKPSDISEKTNLEPNPKINYVIRPALSDLFKSKSNSRKHKESETDRKFETKVIKIETKVVNTETKVFNTETKVVNTETKVVKTETETVKAETKIVKTDKQEPTCIMTSRTEIDMVFYNIKYFFVKNMTALEILLSNSESNYKLEMLVPPNRSIFDFITKEIEPCLMIKYDNVYLEQPKEVLLAKGMLINENSSGSIKLTRYYPRWKIKVEINEKSKLFEMSDIKSHFPSSVNLIEDLNSLIVFFTLDSTEIQINMVTAWPLRKIYENSIQNDYLKTPICIKIDRVNYLNSHSYLIQVKDSLIQPLLIENKVICIRRDNITPNLNEAIKFLIKNIRINNCNQLELVPIEEVKRNMGQEENSKKFSIFQTEKKVKNKKEFDRISTLSNLGGLHQGINKVRSISILKDNPAQSNIPKSPTIKLKPTEENKVMIKGILTDSIDLEDRIILRTCLSKNNTLYQICMSLSKGEILNFYIRKGSDVENLSKFSILVSLICEKTGLRKDLLIPLGSYVLRNMLIINDADICYFDFSKPATDPGHAIEKISGLLKALHVRKRVNINLKNLVGKRKIKLDGVIYTCLIYIWNEVMYIRLVRGAEVLSLDLSLAKVVKDGYFSSIDKFFNSLTSLGLIIVDNHGKRVLGGLERYRLN